MKKRMSQKRMHRGPSLGLALAMGLICSHSSAQSSQSTPQASPEPAVVPRLVKFGGTVKDVNGKPMAGVAGVTFALYKDEQGGAPLWLETQNVPLDSSGDYSVMLGSTKADGLPVDLFASGEARWLGVQPEGQPEQPRALLLSVPYALKAADAETLGGLPPSAFLAAPAGIALNSAVPAIATSSNSSSAPPAGTVTGSGTANFVPLWTSSSNIGNSVLFQTGSGPTAKVGLNTSSPSTTLDVNGAGTIRGTLALPATGAATATAGKKSQALNLTASAFSASTAAAVNQTFQWQAEPAGNNTTSPSATLNLLFGSGTSTPAETGLKLSSKGLFTFATGQTFPGTGTITAVTTANGSGLAGGGSTGSLTLSLTKTCTANQVLEWNGSVWACSTMSGGGTITGVKAGTELTGGGTSGTVTLNLDTTKVAQLNAANTFNGNQTITGNLSDTGNISAAGLITGQTGSFSGNTSGFTGVLSVKQSGSGEGIASATTSGTAVTGFAGATSGVTFGVAGSVSSGSGVGVSGEGGTGVLGIGFAASGGTGVSGTGKFGVQGTSSLSSGTGGLFNNTASGESLSAQINGAEVFGVYPGGTLVNGGGLIVGGNAASAVVGDPGCGAGFAGIGFGGLSGCNNYSLIGDSKSTYLNRPLGGSLFFREANGTQMTIAPGGAVSITSASTTFGFPAAAIFTSSTNGGSGASFSGGSSATNGGAAGVGMSAFGGGGSNGATPGDGGDFFGGVATNNSFVGGVGVLAVGGGQNSGACCTGDGIVADVGPGPAPGLAGVFNGNVDVTGTLNANSKNFKIDHPLDPANKYLYHASVESSEMMNIYTGNVILDTSGEAAVELPNWFEALNRDFRYQLTCLGAFAPVFIAQEIQNRSFKIAGGHSGLKVSWQITGIRQDAYAKAHPLLAEVDKSESERGHYINPELYGAPEEKSVGWARHPELMKRLKERRQTLATEPKP